MVGRAKAGLVRVLLDPAPGTGAWNMAVDELLLEAAVERNEIAVRWYRWREATVSLGYFQPATAVAADPSLAELPAVRRLTGGGAILHDRELTYSCAVPAEHPLAREPLRLYEDVHTAIVEVLARRDVAAALRGSRAPGAVEPFLCFGRGDARDVVFRGHKILGSAQRRRRGAVLQHGSLLLAASPAAPDFPGLHDLAARLVLNAGDVDQLAAALTTALGATSEIRPLTITEQERAEILSSERYQHLDWHRARGEHRRA